MQADPPKLEFTYDPGHTEYWELVAWENDTHIKLKGYISLPPAPYDQEARLVRSQNGWTLRLGIKTARPGSVLPPPEPDEDLPPPGLKN